MAPHQLSAIIEKVSGQVQHLAVAEPPLEDEILCGYLRSREETRIGRDFAFSALLSAASPEERYKAFRTLPLTDYSFYAPYIGAIEAGEADVLGPAQPKALTLSGGSTNPGKQKLVPLYSDLTINHAGAAYVGARLFDKIAEGETYLNLVRPSQVEKLPKSAAGLPIAMASTFVESACLAAPLFSDAIEKVPFALKCGDTAVGAGYWRTLLPYALAQSRLRYIFAIYPNVVISFLSCLKDSLADIIAILADPPQLSDASGPHITQDRLDTLREICAASLPPREMVQQIWPDLEFAVCVVTGGYEQYQKVLSYQYGLDAYTLSYGASEAALGYNLFSPDRLFTPNPSTFFEALPSRDGTTNVADVVPLSQTVQGEIYELVVTSPQSGFFRYRIGDIVRIVMKNGRPLFELIGRSQAILSVAHEMTQEHHVRSVLDAACQHPEFSELRDGPCFVAPDPSALCYVYAFETTALDMAPDRIMDLRQFLDREMQAANDLYQHYRVRQLIELPEVLLLPTGAHHCAFQEQVRMTGLDPNQSKPNVVMSQDTLKQLRYFLEEVSHGV